jgi:ABC-type oligopeptide transport system substrate-binding subunit
MKKTLMAFMCIAIFALSLFFVSCQKQEKTTKAGDSEKAAGYGEQTTGDSEKAAGYGEQATEQGEKAKEDAGGYGQ